MIHQTNLLVERSSYLTDAIRTVPPAALDENSIVK